MRHLRIVPIVLLIGLMSTPVFAQGHEAVGKSEAECAVHAARPYLVSISVADLDATLKWYGENLGFEVIRKMDLPAYSLRIAFVELNGFQLELIEFKQSVPYEAIRKQFPVVDDRAKVQGPGKLAFLVDDIEKAAVELKGKGVKFVRNVTIDRDFGEKWFMVEDNSGNIIQFIQKMK